MTLLLVLRERVPKEDTFKGLPHSHENNQQLKLQIKYDFKVNLLSCRLVVKLALIKMVIGLAPFDQIAVKL